MKVVDNENVVCYDVDDTLVLWFSGCDPALKVEVVCPYGGSVTHLKPHKRHIDLLKKHHGRGAYVVVWSAAGAQWAKAVIDALGLEPFVDEVITKPSKYVDDLPASEILGTRIYLTDKDDAE